MKVSTSSLHLKIHHVAGAADFYTRGGAEWSQAPRRLLKVPPTLTYRVSGGWLDLTLGRATLINDPTSSGAIYSMRRGNWPPVSGDQLAAEVYWSDTEFPLRVVRAECGGYGDGELELELIDDTADAELLPWGLDGSALAVLALDLTGAHPRLTVLDHRLMTGQLVGCDSMDGSTGGAQLNLATAGRLEIEVVDEDTLELPGLASAEVSSGPGGGRLGLPIRVPLCVGDVLHAEPPLKSGTTYYRCGVRHPEATVFDDGVPVGVASHDSETFTLAAAPFGRVTVSGPCDWRTLAEISNGLAALMPGSPVVDFSRSAAPGGPSAAEVVPGRVLTGETGPRTEWGRLAADCNRFLFRQVDPLTGDDVVLVIHDLHRGRTLSAAELGPSAGRIKRKPSPGIRSVSASWTVLRRVGSKAELVDDPRSVNVPNQAAGLEPTVDSAGMLEAPQRLLVAEALAFIRQPEIELRFSGLPVDLLPGDLALYSDPGNWEQGALPVREFSLDPGNSQAILSGRDQPVLFEG